MLPQRLPQPVHPDALEVVTERWRRVLPWLWVGTLAQVAITVGGVLGVVTLVDTVREQVAWAIVMCLPPLTVWVIEIRGRWILVPESWQVSTCMAVFLPGMIAGAALSPRYDVLPQLTGAAVCIGSMALVWLMYHRAALPLRTDLVPELAQTPFTLTPMKSFGGWTLKDRPSISMSSDELSWLVPEDDTQRGRHSNDRLRLEWITAVGYTDTGVVVTVENSARSEPRRTDLEVEEPRAHAELLRQRVQEATGRVLAPVTLWAQLAQEVPRIDPDLLPAPEPVGALAHPIDAPPRMTYPPLTPVAGVLLAAIGLVAFPAITLIAAAQAWPGAPLTRWMVLVGVYLTIGMVLLRHRPRGWWPLAWVAAIYSAVGTGAAQPLYAEAWIRSPQWVIGTWFAAITLTVTGGLLAARVHPIHTRTRTRISTNLRHQNGWLVCEGERLVLHLQSTGNGGQLSQAMTLSQVELVQPGDLTEQGDAQWPLPGSELYVGEPGPGLRIVGGGQQWLLKPPDPALIADIISARARRATTPPPQRLPTREWRPLQDWYQLLETMHKDYWWKGGLFTPLDLTLLRRA